MEVAQVGPTDAKQPDASNDSDGRLDTMAGVALTPGGLISNSGMGTLANGDAGPRAPDVPDFVLHGALEAANVGIWSLDAETGHYVARSRLHDRMFGYSGYQPAWTREVAEHNMIDEDRPAYRAAVERARVTGELLVEFRVRWSDGSVRWIRSKGGLYGAVPATGRQITGIVSDITAERARDREFQKRKEQREFSIRLSKAMTEHADPVELQRIACRMLGEQIGASRVFYCEVDDAGWNTSGPQYVNGVPPGEKIWRSDDYDSTLIDRYRDGEVLHCDDISCSLHLTASQKRAYAREEIVAWAAVPIAKPGLPLGRLVVHQNRPRQWTEEELALIRETAERVWPVIQRARVEAELHRMAFELQRAQDVARLASYRFELLHRKFAFSPQAIRLFDFFRSNSVSEEEWLTCIHVDDRSYVEGMWRRAAAGVSTGFEYRVTKNGTTLWIDQRAEAERSADGSVFVVFGTMQDISERRQLMDTLHRNEERLRLALDAAKMGVWDRNLLTDTTEWSDQCFRLLGIETDSSDPGLVEWLSHVHPEDRSHLATMMLDVEGSRNEIIAQYRVLSGDGTIRWIEAHGRNDFDGAGRAIRSYGLLMDITERKHNEAHLIESEARFRTLFEHLPVAYQCLDIDGCWIDANQKMADLLGFSSPEEMIGLCSIDYWSEEIQALPVSPFDSFKSSNELTGILKLLRRDGTPITVMISGRVERGSDNRFLRSHCILFDVTEREAMERQIRLLNIHLEQKIEERTAELAAANEALAKLARHDELTGLPNRLAANERLRLEFVTMKRTSRPYAVLMMDIDHFKSVNDRYGHHVGDRALCQIADAFRQSIRGRDFVCRFGGEEFLALLPETSLEGAVKVAENFRRAVSSIDDPTAGVITISVGISIASVDQGSEDDSVKEADRCLYLAKAAGRNRIEFA